jgi:hypothetical protein
MLFSKRTLIWLAVAFGVVGIALILTADTLANRLAASIILMNAVGFGFAADTPSCAEQHKSAIEQDLTRESNISKPHP